MAQIYFALLYFVIKNTKLMEQKKLSLKNPKVQSYYNGLLTHMRKQYKDVVTIQEAHINARGKVFSAMWTDSRGVSNFCGGYLIDTVKIVQFTD